FHIAQGFEPVCSSGQVYAIRLEMFPHAVDLERMKTADQAGFGCNGRIWGGRSLFHVFDNIKMICNHKPKMPQ
ncbi:hypothetical protein, partial [Acidithiobacillus albertensis]|uniref:hypothetical protein n=1 Tax=Acidithiobacillus albertensis TaxID=119978 RepID=UPI000A95A4F5